MSRKFLLLAVLLIFFPILAIYAQEEDTTEDTAETEAFATTPLGNRPDFWFSIGGETAFYGISGLAYGGHFALGYGSGSSIGIKASLFFT